MISIIGVIGLIIGFSVILTLFGMLLSFGFDKKSNKNSEDSVQDRAGRWPEMASWN